MNSSVPPLSPSLMAAALTRIPIITPTIAQNSVVLKAFFVSVARRRAPRANPAWRGASASRVVTSLVVTSLVATCGVLPVEIRGQEFRAYAQPDADGPPWLA